MPEIASPLKARSRTGTGYFLSFLLSLKEVTIAQIQRKWGGKKPMSQWGDHQVIRAHLFSTIGFCSFVYFENQKLGWVGKTLMNIFCIFLQVCPYPKLKIELLFIFDSYFQVAF